MRWGNSTRRIRISYPLCPLSILLLLLFLWLVARYLNSYILLSWIPKCVYLIVKLQPDMKDLLYFEHKKQQKNGGGGGSVECSWLPTRGSVECIDHNQRLYCFAENTDNNISSHSKVSYFNWPFQTPDEYYLEMVITATIQTTPSPVPKSFGGAEWGISTIFMLDIIIKRFNKGSPKIDQGVIASFIQRWSILL